MQYGPFGKSTVTTKTVPAAAAVAWLVLAKSIAANKSNFADALLINGEHRHFSVCND